MNDERPTDPAAHGRPRDGGRIDPDRVHGVAADGTDVEPITDSERLELAEWIASAFGFRIEFVSRPLPFTRFANDVASGRLNRADPATGHVCPECDGWCDCHTDDAKPCVYCAPLPDGWA